MSRVLCKYFLHGACLKGDTCEYSHDWKDQSNEICTYYLKGACAYGDRCRYQHVRRVNKAAPLTLPPRPRTLQSAGSSAGAAVGADRASSELTRVQPLAAQATTDAWQTVHDNFQALALDDEDEWGKDWGKDVFSCNENEPLCSLAVTGNCPVGDACNRPHGERCPFCGKNCLHPFNVLEREGHLKVCERNQKKLEALFKSKDVECGVCLEKVLSKPTPAERKFGLMSGCDHSFCMACIRGWRSTSNAAVRGLNAAVRSCPICRLPSHYIIPSIIWYFSPEEKDEIVSNYRKKLSEIDCKHFDFGNQTCPFGTSCFYKHAYKDGRKEEVKLRHLGAADGGTVIAKDVRLSDFLGAHDLGRE